MHFIEYMIYLAIGGHIWEFSIAEIDRVSGECSITVLLEHFDLEQLQCWSGSLLHSLSHTFNDNALETWFIALVMHCNYARTKLVPKFIIIFSILPSKVQIWRGGGASAPKAPPGSEDKVNALNIHFKSVFTRENLSTLPTISDTPSYIPDMPNLSIG